MSRRKNVEDEPVNICYVLCFLQSPNPTYSMYNMYNIYLDNLSYHIACWHYNIGCFHGEIDTNNNSLLTTK